MDKETNKYMYIIKFSPLEFFLVTPCLSIQKEQLVGPSP